MNAFSGSGYLFFLESLRVMLFDYSIDIYRTPLHNIRSLLKEYEYVHNDVQADRVPSVRLKPIAEEIKSTFPESIACKSVFTPEERNLIQKLLDQEESKTIEAIRYLLNRLPKRTFCDAIISCLKSKLTSKKNKDDILRLSRELIPELHSLGYSYEYIFHVVNLERRRLRTVAAGPTELEFLFSTILTIQRILLFSYCSDSIHRIKRALVYLKSSNTILKGLVPFR